VLEFKNISYLTTAKLLGKYLMSCDATQLDELGSGKAS
jgi:hypothetical protein